MRIKNTITGMVSAFAGVALVNVNALQAVQGTYEEAMAIRRRLSAHVSANQKTSSATAQSAAVAETLLLPVSRGFNQLGTALCWSYSTLNALETIHLVRNPDGPDVELSRRAMQCYTWEDRYRRSIKGVQTYLSEGGVVSDAIRLIQANGIVYFDDYLDISDPYGEASIGQMIDGAGSVTEKIMALYEGLDIILTAPPTLTHIPIEHLSRQGPVPEEATPGELASFLLAGDVWQSYTPSETKVGFHDHPDPDARWETVSWHMPASEFPGRIRQALEAGFPVIVTVRVHTLLVYGADYDSNGSPIAYYIKDSYPDYFYRATANQLHEDFWEMTTVKLWETASSEE